MYAIVEDCDTTRALLVSVVKSMLDEEVAGFGSAEGFIRELRVSAPDLSAIFLDINLPGISGLELIVGIKKIPNYSNVPIVICSASNDRQVIVKALKAGAVNFVMKPFSRPQIEEVIKTLPKKEIQKQEPSSASEGPQQDEGDDLSLLNESAVGMMKGS